MALSLIIPAHNEAAHIERLLRSLEADIARGVLVFVVANGCSDDTVARAQAFGGVTVIDIATPSKIVALREGDRAAGDHFPRLYVDADIVIAPGSIEKLEQALRGDDVRAVAPRVVFDEAGASLVVRGFYQWRRRHPWAGPWQATHLAGRRIYGTNKAGRARFGEFPDLINDDGFFDQLFSADERVIVNDAVVTTPLRPRAAEEIRRLVRVRRGNEELDRWFDRTQTPRPDRLATPSERGSRLSRIATRLRRSGLITEFTPRLVIYGLCYAYIVWSTKRTSAKEMRVGAELDWGAKSAT
jgi:glycosyltransferase involved in cell wall biosynthesis